MSFAAFLKIASQLNKIELFRLGSLGLEQGYWFRTGGRRGLLISGISPLLNAAGSARWRADLWYGQDWAHDGELKAITFSRSTRAWISKRRSVYWIWAMETGAFQGVPLEKLTRKVKGVRSFCLTARAVQHLHFFQSSLPEMIITIIRIFKIAYLERMT